MGYLIQCSDKKEFESIMKNVFTLTRNEFVSTHVNEAKNTLMNLVCTHEPLDIENDNICVENVEENFKSDINSYKDTCSYRWVMSVYNSVNLSSDRKIENIYHSPASEKYLIHCFVRCPLWSNLMIHEFESNNCSATSAPVENEFKTIKTLLGSRKRRVDLAVINHFDYLSGQMKLGKAQQNFQNLVESNVPGKIVQIDRKKGPRDSNEFPIVDCERSPKDSNEFPVEDRDSSLVSEESPPKMPIENWGGWMRKPVKSVRNRRAANSILNAHDPEYFHSGILLLDNGYDSPKIYTENTFAFDSIYPIYCAVLLDHNTAKIEFISNEPFPLFVQGIVERTKSLTKLYNLRNEILLQIFSSDAYKESKNLKKRIRNRRGSIDCFTGLAGFFSQLNVPSYVERGHCDSCGFDKNTRYPLIPIQITLGETISLHNIDNKIITPNKYKNCSKCKHTMKISRDIQNIVAIEVEPTNNENKEHGANWYALENIQKEITLQNHKFQLLGVISHSHKHFTAYVFRRNKFWEKYDDLCPKAKKLIPDASKIIVNAFMLFYIKA